MRLDGHRVDDIMRRRSAPGDDLRLAKVQLGERDLQWGVVDVERNDQRVGAVTGLVHVLPVSQPQRRRVAA